MAIREGRWDCAACDTRGNLGRDRACKNCGRPRADDVKFYLPDDAEEVTDAAQLALAKAGADWYCEHCGSGQTNANADCLQCGAPRGSSPQHKLAAPPPPPPPVDNRARDRRQLKLIGAAFLVVFLLWFFLGRTTEAPVTVSALGWERSVAVEVSREVREGGWDRPSGARNVVQSRKLHHTDKVVVGHNTREREVSEKVKTGTRTVVVGKRDLGNGMFEDITKEEPIYETRTRTESYQDPVYQDRPVYQTWYEYDIDKWVEKRTDRAAGADKNAAWPAPSLARGEREGKRVEKYTATVQLKDGKTQTIEVDKDLWDKLQPGQPVVAVISAQGSVQQLKP
jgi:hypothetical protein